MDRHELGRLTPHEWDRLQQLVDNFEHAWRHRNNPGDSVELQHFLPPSADPVRLATLHELIKTELEIRWRRGQGVSLKYYLQQFPELGSSETVPAALIYEEYRVRQIYGDKLPLTAYETLFPQQFSQVQRLVEVQPVPARTSSSQLGKEKGSRVVSKESGSPEDLTGEPTPDALSVRAESPEPALGKISRQEVFPVGRGYRLINRISRGAFGEVWRAEAPGGIEVAIKIILGSIADDQARREWEALESIKRLHHPFLLSIHAYWQREEQLMIAMELAEGSLRERLDQCRQAGLCGVPADELVCYFREAAEAVDYLHSKQVLHRDIKPENILRLEGHAKVADFGLARVVEQTRRLVSASDCGTPAYTAPEVFWRGKVGGHSDQYSLAAAYAELRLNRPLFPSRSWFKLMQDHLQRSPDLVPLLDAEQGVLCKALAKDPNERYASCREFLKALERAIPH